MGRNWRDKEKDGEELQEKENEEDWEKEKNWSKSKMGKLENGRKYFFL